MQVLILVLYKIIHIYLHITFMSTFSIRVRLRYFAVQMYWPESSAVTFKSENLAIPPLCSCWRSPPSLPVPINLLELSCKNLSVLSGHFVHVRKDEGKLSRLQVRFRVSPSLMVKVPETSISFTSEKQNHGITLMTVYNFWVTEIDMQKCILFPAGTNRNDENYSHVTFRVTVSCVVMLFL